MAGRLSCRRRSCLRWRCCPSLLLPARPPRRKTNTVGVRVAAPVTPAAVAAAYHALILLLLRRRLAAEKIGTPQYHRRLGRSGDHHERLPHPTCFPCHRQQQQVQEVQEVVAGSARTVRASRRPGLRSASGRWLMKGIVWC